MTWNILHGASARRLPGIALTLIEHAPDVLVLTEFRGRNGGQLAGLLADHGWVHQHSTVENSRHNALFFASRVQLVPLGNTTSFGTPKLCAARLPELDLTLVGSHAPDGVLTRDKAEHWLHLRTLARAHRDGNCIILGDLNAGRHRLDEDGNSLPAPHLLGHLASLGYRDAWRDRHGSAREYSWIAPTGGGFRLDHILVSSALARSVRAAWYSHAPRETGLSDHSPALLDLDLVSPVFSGPNRIMPT